MNSADMERIDEALKRHSKRNSSKLFVPCFDPFTRASWSYQKDPLGEATCRGEVDELAHDLGFSTRALYEFRQQRVRESMAKLRR